MGVYIKDMEMPVIELEWTIRRGADGKWYAIDTNAETSDGEWHEIVPVPPHGRLIDADVLEHDFKKLVYQDNWYYNSLHHAPTIIPASEDSVKTEEDSEPWLCLSCRHYPPSSTDGKPCTQCNPSEVWHSCYDPAEEGQT